MEYKKKELRIIEKNTEELMHKTKGGRIDDVRDRSDQGDS